MIADQFRTTFAALETAFATRFEQLFGGGFARLSLTDPSDLGSTGIEIVARPPGKKAQALAMLSGGERALTAVALLFAMLEVRPVPFCVLDEVDAALDEANIGRFADALRSLAHQTQFIVITHNRGHDRGRRRAVRRDRRRRLGQPGHQPPARRGAGARRRATGASSPRPGRLRRCPSGDGDRRRAARRPRSTNRSIPTLVDPDWEPDPADFGVARRRHAGRAAAGRPIRSCRSSPSRRRRPMTIDIPTAGPDSRRRPTPAWAEPVAPSRRPTPTHEAALDAGLERTRGSFMSRLRGYPRRRAPARARRGTRSRRRSSPATSGPRSPIDLVERARQRRDPGGAEAAIRAELAALLVARDLDWSPRSAVAGGPAVVLVVGVNGTGKTTTIGKLASRYAAEGRSVILAAADTFRAAAIDQLRIWADRAEVPMVAHAPGADPGAVVYDALDAAVARGADLVIADTAGRLHTKSNLMDELSKVRRIIDKRLPGAEPETLFVLDATTGQNGLAQAKAFHEAVGLTGIVLTKLDSTAKGGIVFAIEDALKVPVRFVGVGEGVGDLIPFDPDAFVAALFA